MRNLYIIHGNRAVGKSTFIKEISKFYNHFLFRYFKNISELISSLYSIKNGACIVIDDITDIEYYSNKLFIELSKILNKPDDITYILIGVNLKNIMKTIKTLNINYDNIRYLKMML